MTLWIKHLSNLRKGGVRSLALQGVKDAPAVREICQRIVQGGVLVIREQRRQSPDLADTWIPICDGTRKRRVIP